MGDGALLTFLLSQRPSELTRRLTNPLRSPSSGQAANDYELHKRLCIKYLRLQQAREFLATSLAADMDILRPRQKLLKRPPK